MKCPACFNPLTGTRIGSVKLDICEGGCGGIWFDAFELQRVESEHPGVGHAMINVTRDPSLRVDVSLKRKCPRCGDLKLQRHFFSAKRQIEVDQCPNCGGYWLDAGELEKIHAERAQSAATKQMRSTEISMESIRFLYRQQLQARPEA